MAKKTVAVLGASTHRSKYGNKSVRAHVEAGWTVFPINPKAGTIEDLEAYKSLSDLPESPDRITVYLPPSVTEGMLDELEEAKASEVWLNPGAGSPTLVAEARDRGLNVIDGCSIVNLGLSPAQFPG